MLALTDQKNIEFFILFVISDHKQNEGLNSILKSLKPSNVDI